MTLLDHLAKLEALAAAATPGKWMDDPECAPLRVFSSYIPPGRSAAIAPTVCETQWSRDGKQGKANAAFIAALDPDTVRALVGVVRAAQAVAAITNGPYLMIGHQEITQREGELKKALAKLGEGSPP